MRTYNTEKEFQLHLASLLRRAGWSVVETEAPLLNRMFFLDIFAHSYKGEGKSQEAGWIIECKRERPNSLPELVSQVCAYRGVFPSTGKNPNDYGWGVSWPCLELSSEDAAVLEAAKIEWIDAERIERDLNTPVRLRKFSRLSAHNRELERAVERLRVKAEIALADYASAKALLAVRSSIEAIDQMVLDAELPVLQAIPQRLEDMGLITEEVAEQP